MLHTYCHMQLNVMCNLSYATTQICSCMCRTQLNFSCKRQLQNPKFLIVLGHAPNGPMHAYTMKTKLVRWLGVQKI